MIQKSKYTFLYHLFILKRLIYVLVSHKKSRTLQFALFSFPLNLLITSAGITTHSSRQYFIIFDLLIFNPIYFFHLSSLSFVLSSSTPALIISHPPISNFLSHSPPFHLNYTTPLPKIVEQIVNILPPTSLSISLSIPKPTANLATIYATAFCTNYNLFPTMPC